MTSAASDPDRVKFQPASDQSLLVYFDSRITLEAHRKVTKVLSLLQSRPIAGVRNLHPAYFSLLIDFDPLQITHAELQARLKPLLGVLQDMEFPEARALEIPACYGGEFGPDLEEVAALHGLSAAQAIELHVSVVYVVYFLGFVPGFAYLGELPEALATPRLATPRRMTAAGSVGIADRQTGIYPLATPGGWRLIGRTPIPMFRPHASEMSFLRVGDCVRFKPISSAEFEALSAL